MTLSKYDIWAPAAALGAMVKLHCSTWWNGETALHHHRICFYFQIAIIHHLVPWCQKLKHLNLAQYGHPMSRLHKYLVNRISHR